MKKILSILLIFIFLISTIGVTFATHFCGGKAVSTKAVISLDSNPCDCKGDIPNSCCKNEIKIFKIEDNYNPSQVNISFSDNILLAIINYSLANTFFFNDKNIGKHLIHKPPLIRLDIPILFQSFRC